MTDPARPVLDLAVPPRLGLAEAPSRPAPADRDLGSALLDSPPVDGSLWLRWTGHDGIRTLHQDGGLARGWVEKDVDGLDGWVALLGGRIVVTGDGAPVVHADAWQAGATLHAVLVRHPVGPADGEREDPDDQEHGLLGDVRYRVRRRAAGTGLRAIGRSLAATRETLRTAYRQTDPGDREAARRAATARDEWQRIHDHIAATAAPLYDPDEDPELQRALRRDRHRRQIAARAREAGGGAHPTAGPAHRATDTHRCPACPTTETLYGALERAGLHRLTDEDHQAVRELTGTLDLVTLYRVVDWLERTRAAALAPRDAGPTPPAGPAERGGRP
ncbi:hypothetical protein ACFWP2_11645 [Kitasatospora sp. NPDC058444]|uniref:hypothetical protein n=1 Tax=Kitasatospora sp. NPDC058444 TaxID=3346504 RepID=UPI0036600EA8